MKPEIIEELDKYCEIERTGSREICDPPPIDTDEDWIVYPMDGNFDGLSIYLQKEGFVEEGERSNEGYPKSDFISLRKDDLNIIIATTAEFYDKFSVATKIAKKLNLRDKADRLMLFKAILYGEAPK